MDVGVATHDRATIPRVLLAPIVHTEIDVAVADRIATALQESNERQVGPRNTHHFTLTVRADDGELLAGLAVTSTWANLWVKDDHRGKGFGTALLNRAEQIALERPCHVAFLSTLTFQAPGFYEKCGYQAFGKLPYAPEPFGRIWYAKRLDGSAESPKQDDCSTF